MKLTRWLCTCPGPSGRSFWRESGWGRANRTRSNNSRPGFWCEDSRFSINKYKTGVRETEVEQTVQLQKVFKQLDFWFVKRHSTGSKTETWTKWTKSILTIQTVAKLIYSNGTWKVLRKLHPPYCILELNLMDLCNVVKSSEKLVEHRHQLLGCAGAGQFSEAHDVGVKDAVKMKKFKFIKTTRNHQVQEKERTVCQGVFFFSC